MLRLSKSALDKFCACPRCFWFAQNHKLKQPDQISSKVWKGVERLSIFEYERSRVNKITPEHLVGQVPDGAFPYVGDRISLKDLRYWGKGLRFILEGVEITTALDDMLQRGEYVKDKTIPLYNVIDYKSKSKPTDEESTEQLYSNQADVFDMACNENGYPTDGMVYFDYWYPAAVLVSDPPRNRETLQVWGSQVISLKAEKKRLIAIVKGAKACLAGDLPGPNVDCTVCAYAEDLKNFMVHLKDKIEGVGA